MLSDADLKLAEIYIKCGVVGEAMSVSRALLAEVKRLRAPLTGEDARVVESVRERLAKAAPGSWRAEVWEAHTDEPESAQARILHGPWRADAHAHVSGPGNIDLIANAPTDLQHLLDLLSRYEHAVHDRELDAGAFVAMERARIVACLRARAEQWDMHGILKYAAIDLEDQGVADPAPPAVVRAELARVRTKVREALDTEGVVWTERGRGLLREALEGEKMP